jgi:hypothetical protein
LVDPASRGASSLSNLLSPVYTVSEQEWFAARKVGSNVPDSISSAQGCQSPFSTKSIVDKPRLFVVFYM